MSANLPNVFSAFQAGRSAVSPGVGVGVAPPVVAPARAGPVSEGDTIDLMRLLQALAETPEGQLPFSAFSQQLPGDPVSRLSATVRLMEEGWLEFVGGISETSDVRITAAGRKVIATLYSSVAQT